jgi:hypothetical protein
LRLPNEKLLHLIWEKLYFDTRNLKTICGKKVQILQQGIPNQNQGCDFIGARLLIDDIEWYGNVEIHLTTNHWYKHNHHKDSFYNSVILHVVYQSNQKTIFREDGSSVPEIEIYPILSPSFSHFWNNMNAEPILCAAHIAQIEPAIKKDWIEELGIIRLQRKAQNLHTRLIENQNDWSETFWQEFAAYFGGPVNSGAFRKVAQVIPYRLLAKYLHEPIWIEALLLGGAGLLNMEDFEEEYIKILMQHWSFLKTKHQLYALPMGSFSFLRMRPAGFPTIRLAQLAAFLATNSLSTSLLLNPLNLRKIKIKVSNYWRTHCHFQKKTPASPKIPGVAFIDTLIVNAILPLSFLYSTIMNKPQLQKEIFEIMNKLKPEKNNITQIYQKLGFPISSLAASQGAIELYKNYCTPHFCPSCKIGKLLLERSV